MTTDVQICSATGARDGHRTHAGWLVGLAVKARLRQCRVVVQDRRIAERARANSPVIHGPLRSRGPAISFSPGCRRFRPGAGFFDLIPSCP